MSTHDELVKRLRCSPQTWDDQQLMFAAADAIKALQRDNAALMTACRIAILALAHAAEKDATYQSAYEALDAVMVPGREA